MSDSLQPNGLQQARLPCPLPTPEAYSNLCPSSRCCHPTISSSIVHFFSQPQSFPASGSFQMSQFFASGGWSIGVSASTSVLPMNIQDWFPLDRLFGSPCIPRDSQESSATPQFQKHQFFGAQLSLWSNPHPYMTSGKTIDSTRWTFVSKVVSAFLCVCVCVSAF